MFKKKVIKEVPSIIDSEEPVVKLISATEAYKESREAYTTENIKKFMRTDSGFKCISAYLTSAISNKAKRGCTEFVFSKELASSSVRRFYLETYFTDEYLRMVINSWIVSYGYKIEFKEDALIISWRGSEVTNVKEEE